MKEQPKRITDFALPVHRSIAKRDLWLGVPFIPLCALAFISLIIIFIFKQIVFLAVAVVLWFILKKITDRDEWLLDIILSSLLQPDDFY